MLYPSLARYVRGHWPIVSISVWGLVSDGGLIRLALIGPPKRAWPTTKIDLTSRAD